MSTFCLPPPDGQVYAWCGSKTHLYIYIPRVDVRFNETELQYFLRDIGIIDYVDFGEVKDKTTNEFRHYCAFVKFQEWNICHEAYTEVVQNSSYRLQISPVEYLMLLPNKNPLPRSKLNTHQLAAFYEDLQGKYDDLQKKYMKLANEVKRLTELVVAANESKDKENDKK